MGVFRLVTVVLAAAAYCYAVDPDRLLSQLQKHHWQIEDGLPHNYVNAITLSPEGYLLVGTDEGLARFDGLRFTPPAVDPALHLDSRWIMALAPARQGGYWLATYDGSIYRIQNGHATIHRNAGGAVQGIFEDSTGALWYDAGGIHRLANQQDRAFPACGGNLGNAWSVFAQDRDGAVWIAGISGLCRYRDGNATRVMPAGREGPVLTVMAEPTGPVWAGTANGLYRVTTSGPTATLSPVLGVSGPVSTLLRDRDGALWAGTWGKGIWRVTSQGAQSWTSRDGLPDDFVRTIFEDREGNLWFGTRSGGLNRWKDTLVEPFGMPEGLTGNFASTVAADAAGVLWFGTYRSGLYTLRDGRLSRRPTPVPELDLVIGALAPEASSLWVGGWQGLFRYSGMDYGNFRRDLPPGCVGPLAIAFDSDQRMWLGCSSGLYRLSAAAPRGADPVLLPGKPVRALLTARDGVLWAGAATGLARIRDLRVEMIPLPPSLPDAAVRHISEDSRGRIWFTTAAPGLNLVSGGAVRTLGPRNGLPSHPLFKPLDDGSGTLWVSSPRGILELPGPQLEDWIGGRRDRIDVITHDMDDGMRSIECHGVSQPGGWRHTDGTVWFPTAKGFVRVDPRHRRTLLAPTVFIEEATSGGQPAPLSALRLPAGARDLRIRFTALRLGSPDHVRFRYRLENEDPDWMEIGATRTAVFNNLPPGRHRLLVSARDDSGAWNHAPTALAFEQLPYFHQTAWFRLLLAAALAGLAVLFYQWRARAWRLRYAAVTAERKRIAREWHDTLLAGLSGVSWQLQATRSRLQDRPEDAPRSLETAQLMVDHCQAEARRIIWDLRDDAPDHDPLPAAVANFLTRQCEGRSIENFVETRGLYLRLPHDIEYNAWRVCQEAIANAVRHAAPSRISVLLEYTASQFMLQVSDDGQGFLPEIHGQAPGHFGLLGMRERLLNFGGTFRIESAPGSGTVVSAAFPLRGKSAP